MEKDEDGVTGTAGGCGLVSGGICGMSTCVPEGKKVRQAGVLAREQTVFYLGLAT